MSDLSPSKPLYRDVVAALADSDERYRFLVEGVTRYAIFMLDPKGIIITWNRGIEELLGYQREEIVGHSGAMVFRVADQKARAFQQELATAKRCGESITNRWAVRKDGTEVRVHDTTTSLLHSDGVLIGYAKVTRREEPRDAIRPESLELTKALATLQAEVEHRRRLEARLLTAVEEERERLGRDLHDDLSQRLAGIAMMTRSLAKRTPGSGSVDRETLVQVGDLLTEAIGVARDLSRGLHPATLTAQGLPAALGELAARVPKAVEFNCPTGDRMDLETAVALHVYRIAEEAVGNAIKHSEADKITIQLEATSAKRGVLTIIDNGKGIAASGGPQGMGLQNMKYRAGVIGGRLTISTASGSGTRVQCTFPLNRLGARKRAAGSSEIKKGGKPSKRVAKKQPGKRL
ncbi:MAG: PAS domain-containing sensor histidine kinase [Verrucomicrobiota bacterium]|nr:PAS domain-containing sensor histidine kinase [Verrucomicrobiota bacterium]